MTVQIRDATAADAGALAGLLAELGYPVAADQVPGRLEMFKVEGNGRVVVAVVDGAVRAFAAVEITYPIHQRRPVAHLTAGGHSQIGQSDRSAHRQRVGLSDRAKRRPHGHFRSVARLRLKFFQNLLADLAIALRALERVLDWT
jgi:hypothetical protein